MHKFNDKCIRWAGVDGLYIGYSITLVRLIEMGLCVLIPWMSWMETCYFLVDLVWNFASV